MAPRQIYRNPNFKRDYECTNIVALEVVDNKIAEIPNNYVHCDENYLKGLTPLYVQGGVRYWGYL